MSGMFVPRSADREMQRAIQAIIDQVNANGSTTGLAALSAKINTLGAAVVALANRFTVLANQLSVLSSASNTFSAGEALSIGDIAVEVGGLVYKATTNAQPDSRCVIGIVASAGASGQPVNIARNENITFAGWAWTVGPVYMSPIGTLTQTEPENDVIVMGHATDAKTIYAFPFIKNWPVYVDDNAAPVTDLQFVGDVDVEQAANTVTVRVLSTKLYVNGDSTAAESIEFTGPGVAVSQIGADVTVNIP